MNKPAKQNKNIPGKGKTKLAKMNMGALKNATGKLILPRLFYQLVIFVLDGSGSMTFKGETGITKGEEVEDSVKKVLTRLQESKNKNSFDISMYAYANEHKSILKQKSISEIDLNASFNPCMFLDDRRATYVADTLEAAEEEVIAYLAKNHDKSSQALILILSDGAFHDQEETEQVCERLKTNPKVSLSSILFRSPDWEERFGSDYITKLEGNMEDIASGKEFFKSTVDADEVRKHMIKSISKVSKVD